MDREAVRIDVARLLEAVENAAPVAAVDVVAGALEQAIGASDVAFLIADFSGDALIRLGHDVGPRATRTQRGETAERVRLVGSSQGRALAEQSVVVEADDGCWWLRAPVTNRGEAIGILEARVAEEPDRWSLHEVGLAAHVMAYVVIANRRYTDLFEWGQRSVPLSLAAEIQHRLLPGSYTCEAGQFTVAAWLEPAGDIAGDTFDFALERDTLHLSMTDAMGHGVEAAVLATVLVGALRNARRAGAALDEQACLASDALNQYTHGSAFVTGQLARIDLTAGCAEIVNAGHPPPLRLRDGRVTSVELEADLPFGSGLSNEYRVQSLPLEPGDRLLFVTDGMLERGAAGVDIERHVEAGAGMHPREAVQHLVRVVLEATGDRLEDDATVMCLDWHGGEPRLRDSAAGANR